VKLTPNITDIRKPAEAAKRGGADAVSLINTINSITSVDLDCFRPSRRSTARARMAAIAARR
jgi:dihydropyrimidine dehydrogenase (NAD+) subunit PreA